MYSKLFLFYILVPRALGTAIPSAHPTFPRTLVGSRLKLLDFLNLTSEVLADGGGHMHRPNITSIRWPEGSCGPDNAYASLDGVRKCAHSLNIEVPTEKCTSVNHLDGQGALLCVSLDDNGSVSAYVQSWSRTSTSQVNTW